jgi:thiamine-monophosphate kinase
MQPPADETELIERYLVPLGVTRADVTLGIGDDAALLRVPVGQELVLTTDALVEGVHFLPGSPPESVGHRALAVNLSDLAAMGADPAWMLLSLILPRADPHWLEPFCRGLGRLAVEHNVALVGGNLSRGPLSITVMLAGLVPGGQALRRAGALPGDDLYVSGTLGDAAAGRAPEEQGAAASAQDPAVSEARWLRERFEYPQPRLALGRALRGLAHACIDISDGLIADAGRLARASGCAVRIDASQLPLSPALRAHQPARAAQFALYGGEDYELCFSAAPPQAAAVQALAQQLQVPIQRVGALLPGAGVDVTSLPAGTGAQSGAGGFDHFRA